MPSALQDVDVVSGGGGPAPEHGHDDRQADHDLGRGHDQYEEHIDLTADVVQVAGEGHERQIHGVQHQLDAHEHDQHVAPDQEPGGAQPEQDGGQHEVPG